MNFSIILFVILMCHLDSSFARKRKLISFSLSEDWNVYHGKLKIEPLGLFSNYHFARLDQNTFEALISAHRPTPWSVHGQAVLTPEANGTIRCEAQLKSNGSIGFEVNSTVLMTETKVDVSQLSSQPSCEKLRGLQSCLPMMNYIMNTSFSVNQSVSGEYKANLNFSPSNWSSFSFDHSLITNSPEAIQFASFVNDSFKEEQNNEFFSHTWIGIDLKSAIWPFMNTDLLQLFVNGEHQGYETMNATNTNWIANVTADWHELPSYRYTKKLIFTGKNDKLPSFILSFDHTADGSMRIEYIDSKSGTVSSSKFNPHDVTF